MPPSIGRLPHRAVRRSRSLVTTGAFWAGALFPVLYLPVFAAGNHLPVGNDVLFALVGLHLLLLFVGRHHLRTDAELSTGAGTGETEESAL